MRVHEEELSDVSRYIRNHGKDKLEEKEPQYRNILKHIVPFISLGAHLQMLEIGTGTGWFPILCTRDGLNCQGLEISPQLVEFAREYGRANGVEANIQLGNIEETDLGEARFDVIIASSVFEHIENWRLALGVVYRALKPGGVLFFESTNKFGLIQGEYPPLFFYGWLPNPVRYRFRMMVHGPDIMKNGIDFHQFRYGLLRRAFREAGFSRVMDRFEILDPESKTGLKRSIFGLIRRYSVARGMARVLAEGTTFVCVK